MLTIYFKIKNQIITRLDATPIVEDSREYLFAQFDFSKEWVGKTKTITFRSAKGTPYNVQLKEDKCLVPWEVINAPGFTISGFGEGESFITINELEVPVLNSGFDENGQVPGTPTPTQWELYKKEIEDIIEGLGGEGGGSVEGAEMIKNKTQVIDENSTEIQYPSAKAVYGLSSNQDFVQSTSDSVIEYISVTGLILNGGTASDK